MKTTTVTDKTIDVTDIGKLIVSGDDSVDKIRFTFDKEYGDTDLSTGDIYLRYQLPSTEGDDVLLDGTAGETSITADWTPTGGARTQ